MYDNGPSACLVRRCRCGNSGRGHPSWCSGCGERVIPSSGSVGHTLGMAASQPTGIPTAACRPPLGRTRPSASCIASTPRRRAPRHLQEGGTPTSMDSGFVKESAARRTSLEAGSPRAHGLPSSPRAKDRYPSPGRSSAPPQLESWRGPRKGQAWTHPRQSSDAKRRKPRRAPRRSPVMARRTRAWSSRCSFSSSGQGKQARKHRRSGLRQWPLGEPREERGLAVAAPPPLLRGFADLGAGEPTFDHACHESASSCACCLEGGAGHSEDGVLLDEAIEGGDGVAVDAVHVAFSVRALVDDVEPVVVALLGGGEDFVAGQSDALAGC